LFGQGSAITTPYLKSIICERPALHKTVSVYYFERKH